MADETKQTDAGNPPAGDAGAPVKTAEESKPSAKPGGIPSGAPDAGAPSPAPAGPKVTTVTNPQTGTITATVEG